MDVPRKKSWTRFVHKTEHQNKTSQETEGEKMAHLWGGKGRLTLENNLLNGSPSKINKTELT